MEIKVCENSVSTPVFPVVFFNFNAFHHVPAASLFIYLINLANKDRWRTLVNLIMVIIASCSCD